MRYRVLSRVGPKVANWGESGGNCQGRLKPVHCESGPRAVTDPSRVRGARGGRCEELAVWVPMAVLLALRGPSGGGRELRSGRDGYCTLTRSATMRARTLTR
jgi:hypothetical protein